MAVCRLKNARILSVAAAPPADRAVGHLMGRGMPPFPILKNRSPALGLSAASWLQPFGPRCYNATVYFDNSNLPFMYRVAGIEGAPGQSTRCITFSVATFYVEFHRPTVIMTKT